MTKSPEDVLGGLLLFSELDPPPKNFDDDPNWLDRWVEFENARDVFNKAVKGRTHDRQEDAE